MPLEPEEARALVADQLLPALRSEQQRLDRIDRWWRWQHDKPHAPRHATPEYNELIDRAYTPWLGLVVTAVAQALYVEGYRRTDTTENAAPWRIWQANRMDGRQMAVHRAALAYGYSYVTVLPGKNADGEDMPVIRGYSPRRMTAFYEDAVADEWPVYALAAEPTKIDGSDAWKIRLFDDTNVYHLVAIGGGGIGKPSLTNIEYVGESNHGVGLCPVVRFADSLDLEGRMPGEVEPYIPVAARIDQTTFDRLVVQRFASWIVRTIAGMVEPGDNEAIAKKKLELKVDDILIAEDPDTKFGYLPATPLDPFIAARDADIRDLAAVSQTPPHHLLGQMANLSAEALAAAESSYMRKVEERQHAFGESWEQVLRLGARIIGDIESWRDVEAQIQWRDVSARSLQQAADALGKLAQMLNVPVEILWEKIPGWTQQDVERAKALAAEQDGLRRLAEQLMSSVAEDQVAEGQTAPSELEPVVAGGVQS